MDCISENEVGGSSDEEANDDPKTPGYTHNYSTARLEPMPLDTSIERHFDHCTLPPLKMQIKPLDDRNHCHSYLDQSFTDCKLPPLGIRMQVPTNMGRCTSSLERTFNDCTLPRLALDATPENEGNQYLFQQSHGLEHRPEGTHDFHRRRSTPESRNRSRRSHSQAESYGIVKNNRRLPIRTIRPQPRRSMSADSRRAEFNVRSSSYRRCSDTYQEPETDSVEGHKKLKAPKPSHSNKACTSPRP